MRTCHSNLDHLKDWHNKMYTNIAKSGHSPRQKRTYRKLYILGNMTRSTVILEKQLHVNTMTACL